MGTNALTEDDDFLQPGGALNSRLGGLALVAADLVRAELPAGHHLGRYRLLGTLGRGGSAWVYLAERTDGELELRVAIKVLHDDLNLQRLAQREREALAKLSHPGIARVIDGGTTPEGMRWLVMEYVDGQPIDRWLASNRPHWTGLLRLMLELCSALNHSHQRFIAHGDLKPSNVFVDVEGRVKVLDFGISGCSRGGSELLGQTPGYASPEQRQGQPPSAASDIYQLGLLFKDWLPYAQSLPRLARRNLHQLIARCCADDPGARYPSVESMQQDLHATLALQPLRGASQRRLGLVFFGYRHRRVLGLASVLLVLVVAQLGSMQHALDQETAAKQRSTRSSSDLAYLSAVLIGEAVRAAGPDNHGLRQVLGERRDQLLANANPDPQRQAELLRSVGIGLAEAGSQHEAASLFQRSLALLPPAPEQAYLRAELSCRLALAQHLDGQRDAAEAAVATALDALSDLPAPANPRFLADFCLGTTLTELGRSQEAGRHLALALSEAETEFGIDSKEYLDVLARWAELNRREGRHQMAFRQQQRVVAHMSALFGADHPALLAEKLRLERSRAWSGDPVLAETTLRQLIGQIPAAGLYSAYAEHASRFYLAEALYFLGRLPESEHYYRESLNYFVSEADEPHSLADRASLAMVMFWAGDFEHSAALLRRVLEGVRRSSPATAEALYSLALAQVLLLGDSAHNVEAGVLAGRALASLSLTPAAGLDSLIATVLDARARIARGDHDGARALLDSPLPALPESRQHEYAIWRIRHALTRRELRTPDSGDDLAAIEAMFAEIPAPLGPDHPLALIVRLEWLQALASEQPARAANELLRVREQLRPSQRLQSIWLARADRLLALGLPN